VAGSETQRPAIGMTRHAPNNVALSRHILPCAAMLLGVCVTLIGLVKIVEPKIGPSHVDEYSALAALVLLTSAIVSCVSIRYARRPPLSRRCEPSEPISASWLVS
jgi:hypothetical protein